MQTIELKKRTLRKMQKIILEAGNINTEGSLYIFDEKKKWKKEKKVYKELFQDRGHVFSNKLYTLNELIDNSELIVLEELILPEKIAVVDGKISGFTMPYIENISFYSILNDSNIPNKTKLHLFKEISNILKEMEKIRNNKIDDFYLNDLHEGNFIYNIETGKINVVDFDSCKINGNKPFPAKYLTPISPISGMPNKYHVNNADATEGYIIPDSNSDLYCYTIMLLNFLYKDKITKLSREGYFLYLEYLISIGLPLEFVMKLAKIYEYTDNENIGEYLYLIDDKILSKSSKDIFLSKK